MPQDKNTAGYLVVAALEFLPVNKYGDKLPGPGSMTYTATLPVKGLSGLAEVLNGLDELFTAGPGLPPALQELLP